jgi:hypothetical protein
MSIRDVIIALNRMEAEGIVDRYAIGGAVGATFYLEPVATIDVDVFVTLRTEPGRLIVTLDPLLGYLKDHGWPMKGEYVLIAGWPVQFLPPTGPLVEAALAEAGEADVEGVPARVLSPEYLAAIALETGRAKDKARLLQFIEEGAIESARFQEIVRRHGLLERWLVFERQYLTS